MTRIIENHLLLPDDPPSPSELRRLLSAGSGNSDLHHGYLGPDEDLQKLIETDARFLEERGLTHEQVAEAVEQLFASENPEEFRGTPIISLEYIHSPPCPWRDFIAVSPFDFRKKVTEIVVINRTKVDEFFKLLDERKGLGVNDYAELVKRDLVAVFSDLHPHLIRAHQFFEGHATPYRVDPTKVAHFLGI
ncbi:MAG: hypothetical protein AAB551_03005 [Patescibacteria group bacterium]